MKNYEKSINKNKVMQNSVALAMLIECGRNNILQEAEFEKLSDTFIKDTANLMTSNFQEDILNILKKLANMEEKDLYEFIHDKVKDERRLEKGR